MKTPAAEFFTYVQQFLRLIACVIVPTFLLLVAAIVLIWQFTEINSRQEILSLTSFLVIMSLSALAFNWSRATHTFTTEKTRRSIYYAGIDLFLASMMALVASCFAWVQSTPAMLYWIDASTARQALAIVFWIHWIFLLLAMLMTLAAILSLILAIRRSDQPQH